MSSVILVILEKLPCHQFQDIFLQQDNVILHRILEDSDIIDACTSGRRKITRCNQFANSLDLIVLDLGFFNSVQSLKNRTNASTIDEFINADNNAFHQSEPINFCSVWITLQLCMEHIMEPEGGNDYKIPHVNKAVVARVVINGYPSYFVQKKG